MVRWYNILYCSPLLCASTPSASENNNCHEVVCMTLFTGDMIFCYNTCQRLWDHTTTFCFQIYFSLPWTIYNVSYTTCVANLWNAIRDFIPYLWISTNAFMDIHNCIYGYPQLENDMWISINDLWISTYHLWISTIRIVDLHK